MRDARKIFYWITAILFTLLLLILLWLSLGYRHFRSERLNDLPLVQIIAPFPGERAPVGQFIPVHATGRASSGIERMELWVDGNYIAAKEADTKKPPSVMVLKTGWRPDSSGTHILMVRARSKGGHESTATATIKTVIGEPASPAGISYLVEEGETLASISSHLDLSEEELLAINPGLEGSSPDLGAHVLIPEDSVAGTDSDHTDPYEDITTSDGAAPSPGGAEPGTFTDVFPLFRSMRLLNPPRGEGDPITLRLEMLSLHSDISFESLHCYLGVGDSIPRWIPDVDWDYSTDESFLPLGDGEWDVASYFAGDESMTINWTGGDLFQIDVTCVGVRGGGRDAVELGRIHRAVTFDEWDGLQRRAVSVGGEGVFSLDYAVHQMSPEGETRLRYLDPEMTFPTNLHRPPGRPILAWEYNPDPEEEPIDGFRLYLNGNFLWSIPARSPETNVPVEWFTPPCGDRYVFHVTAFRHPYPDGPESLPSNLLTYETGSIGDPACDRLVSFVFETLRTYELGGDQDHDGWVGPMYGSFYVDEDLMSFDSRCAPERYCEYLGLESDREYNISRWIGHHGLFHHFLSEVRQGHGVILGFELRDEDTWFNPDDTTCAGELFVSYEELDENASFFIDSTNERCRVRVSTQIAFGSPVGEAGADPALPNLFVYDLTVDEETGQMQIYIGNDGSGSWSGHDLDVAVFWQSRTGGEGIPIGVYTFEDFSLPFGMTTMVQHPDLAPDPPLGVCVRLDPGNQVLEFQDTLSAPIHASYCPPLPDLTLSDVRYEYEGERLLISVDNIGSGSMINRNMDFRINLPDGRYLVASDTWWSGSTIPRGRTVVFEWPGFDLERRAMLADGYTVIVDPNNDIAEHDGMNNSFEVPRSVQLQLATSRITHQYYPVRDPFGYWIEDPEEFSFGFIAQVASAGFSQSVAEWTYDYVNEYNPFGAGSLTEERSEIFTISGDEHLVITASGNFRLRGTLYRLGTATNSYDSSDEWGAHWTTNIHNPCWPVLREPSPHTLSVHPSGEGWTEPWILSYYICRVE